MTITLVFYIDKKPEGVSVHLSQIRYRTSATHERLLVFRTYSFIRKEPGGSRPVWGLGLSASCAEPGLFLSPPLLSKTEDKEKDGGPS